MSWDNTQANGRFGPFSNSGSGVLQTGLPSGGASPLTPPAPATPKSGMDFSGYNPATNSTGYGVPDPSTLTLSPNFMANTESGNGISNGSSSAWNAANGGWGNGAGDNSTITSGGAGGGGSTQWNGTQGGWEGLADGGLIPAQGGTVAPDMDTALASVQSALGAGRKAFGLPSDLLGDGGSDSDQDGDQQKSKNGQDWQPDQDFVDAAKETPEQQMDKAYIPAVTGIGSGMATALRNDSLPPVPGPAMADGGVVPTDGGDMDAPEGQGMPPQPQDNVEQAQPGQTQPANDPMAALKAYAMGAGAMPPDQAMALEQQVDPAGSMDPSQRKLLAVASAQDPKTQFSLLQHYRQRFQALSAFARAAAEGTQARPANITASTDAATRAFHNVPNGHSISFAPAGPGKVAVTVANYAGAGKSKQKSYDDGGPVTPDPEDSGPEAMSGMPPDVGGVLPDAAQGAQDVEANADQTMTQPVSAEDVKGVLPTPENPLITGARVAGKVVRGVEGAAEAGTGKVKQTVMSVSDYLNALKNSMYDAYLGKSEPDQVLAKAASGAAGGAPNPNSSDADQPTVGTFETAKSSSTPIVYGNADQAPGAAPAAGQQQADQDVRPFGNNPDEPTVLPDHPTRAQIDAFNASNGGNRGGAPSTGIDPKIEAQAAELFPRVSQQAQRAAYIERALEQQRPIEGQIAVQKERNVGMKDLWGQKEGAINGRNAATNATRIQIAQMQAMQRAWASGQRDFTSLVNSQRAAAPGLPPEEYAKMALKTIQNGGPMGMPFQPPGGRQQGAPQQAGQPAPITGPIAVNPATGQRMTVRNGQWVPIPAGQ